MIDQTKTSKTVEQEAYAELFEELMKKSGENVGYVPNPEIETEFTKPIASIIWVGQNIPKNKQFLSGLDKLLARDLQLQLLNNYGPFMAQEFNKMGGKVMNEIVPMAQMVMLQHNDNKKSIEKLIENENDWNSVKNAKDMLKQGKMAIMTDDETEGLRGIPTDPRDHKAYLQEIIENGTPSK